MIATFADEPYRAPFSGNVIELCPVGALTSTQYRFEAPALGDPERPDRLRPLPRRLQHERDDPRGEGQADPLAQPPRGRRRLALRQGPLRLRAPARPRPDHRSAARAGPRRFEALELGRRRSTRPSGCCARPARRSLTALSGTETVEQAYALAQAPARRARRARGAAARGRSPTRSTPSARRSRRSATPRRSSCSATSRSVERAPVVDLWIKAARRNGAPHPHRAARGAGRGRRPDHRRRRARRLARPRPRRGGGLLPAAHAERPRRHRRLELRRRRRAGRRRAGARRHLRRRGRRRSGRARARRRAPTTVIGIGMFEESFRGLADLVLPGTSYLERDGTTVNLEGRLQRQRRAVDRALPRRARLDREARRALRGRALAARRGRSSRRSRRSASAASPSREVGEQSPLPAPADGAAGGRRRRRPQPLAAGSGLRLLALPAALLRPGGRADARARTSSGPAARSSSRRADARARGIARRRRGDGRARTGPRVALRARIAARPAGGQRPARRTPTPPGCTSSSR